jgi:DNA invertase Pin-like site-specific DNA recombinase
MRKIIKLSPTVPILPVKKRVAAYARVSIEKGRTLHALSAQVSDSSAYIQKHTEWEYAGVYADSGESGTSRDRDEFKRLLADCEAGKIDIILTKSISRFARNTVDLLETVRHLRELGVEVRFEEQNINSMSGDGELMMTILASFAQEESRSLSENVKWGIRKGFQKGITNSFNVYGYRWNGEKFVIEPKEAEIVRIIFADYLAGKSPKAIARKLTGMGVKPMYVETFPESTVRMMLENDKYVGDLVLQKSYIENHITHRDRKNNGELPKYVISDAHEAIIDRETFAKVQAEKERRKKLGCFATDTLTRSAFTSKITCEVCGVHFYRSSRSRTNGKFKVWICCNRKEGRAHNCEVKDLPENILQKVSAEVLGLETFDPDVFAEKIEEIVVPSAHTLVYHFYDGRTVTKEWISTARRDCWTPEARAAVAERMRHRVYSEEERKARSEWMKKYWAKDDNRNGRRKK